MISSGVPILEALRITARSAGNRVVEKAVMQARAAVTAGRTLSEPLRAAGVPAHGRPHDSRGRDDRRPRSDAGKVADFYDDEVDTAVGRPHVMEPAMIVWPASSTGNRRLLLAYLQDRHADQIGRNRA